MELLREGFAMVLVGEKDEDTRVVFQELLQPPKQAEVVVASLLCGRENNK